MKNSPFSIPLFFFFPPFLFSLFLSLFFPFFSSLSLPFFIFLCSSSYSSVPFFSSSFFFNPLYLLMVLSIFIIALHSYWILLEIWTLIYWLNGNPHFLCIYNLLPCFVFHEISISDRLILDNIFSKSWWWFIKTKTLEPWLSLTLNSLLWITFFFNFSKYIYKYSIFLHIYICIYIYIYARVLKSS